MRIAQNRDYLAHVHSSIAAFWNLPLRALAAFSTFLAYIAVARGPTPSASALVYGGTAAVGTILYEAWHADPAAGYPSRGLLCERGCLRRWTNDLRLKAIDEIRLHQDVFHRRFRHAYVAGPMRERFSPLQLARFF